jgi:hypothetical protein
MYIYMNLSLILILSLVLLLVAAAVAEAFLRKPKKPKEVITLSDVVLSVDAAMTSWGNMVKSVVGYNGTIVNQEVAVSAAFSDYKTAMLTENFKTPDVETSAESLKTATVVVQLVSSFLSIQFSIKKFPLSSLDVSAVILNRYKNYAGHEPPG